MRWLPYLLSAAGLLGGCAHVPPPAPAWAFEASTALPADVAAAVIAGAVRGALQFADPEPCRVGAPLSQEAEGDYLIAAHRDGDGNWRMKGTHRLRLSTAERDLQLVVHRETMRVPAPPETGDGLRFWIAREPSGTLVLGRIPDELRMRVQPAVARALAYAERPLAAPAAIVDPNLAMLVARALLCQALVAKDHERHPAGVLLRRCAALGMDHPLLHAALADLAWRHGDLEQAREHRWQAMLASGDPVQRRSRARALETLGRSPRDVASALRRAAQDALAVGDGAAAADLLHSARRSDPEQPRDYRLQRKARERDNDPLSALALTLLAREHAPWRTPAGEVAADLRDAGLERLAALAERKDPMARPPR